MIDAGNDAIDLVLKRHKHGIRISVKTAPEIEAFFEQWANGMQERPTHGRLWSQRDPGPLTLWTWDTSVLNPSATRPYSLTHTGAGLYVSEHSYPNISFLRLVGASVGDGKEIIVEAVMGRSEILQLAQRMSEACNLFYEEYIHDINVRAVVNVFRLPVAA